MQIGPYQVVEEVARGGMGVVYRAQGTDGAHVALKLILAHKAADPRAQQRFQAEVNALARLRHPHVVGILAAGEHEGSPWLALEFVEGQTLEARLRGGPLPIWEALRVAQQLAQALSYVHSCGLLHRDLKPANVLLRDTQALITDFGLVLDDQSSLSRITATGVFQGTPGFWAPEQARGEVRKHGPATDVYGFGAVLYACLTGQAPVQAGSLQDLLQTIHFETTQPPRKVRPEVPEWLSELCMRCLAVVPASRPASADEVARALVLAGGSGSEASAGVGSRKGIYAALAALVGVAALAVVGWWATGNASQGSIVDPPAVDEPLTEQPSEPPRSAENRKQAQALCDAGLAKANAGRYAEAIDDFDEAIELGLSPAEVDQVQQWRADAAAKLAEQSGSPPGSPEQGKPGRTFVSAGIADYNAGRYAQAIEDFDKALELDPNDARTYFQRAGCKSKLRRYAESIDDYDKGLELDPRVALAYADRALSKTYLGRLAEAIDDYDKALELDPKHAVAYANRASSKARLGRHAEAIEDYDKALELNPSNALAYTNRGLAKKKLRRTGEAIEDFDKALGLNPSDAAVYAHRGLAKAQLGRRAEAIEDYDTALELNPRDTSAYFNRGNSQVDLGRYAEAIEDFSKVLELDPRVTPAYTNRGIAKAKLGRYAEAIEDYDRALEAGLSPSKADGAKRLRAEAAAKLEGSESTRR